MKLKLDENIHGDVADALRVHGHDVLTVPEQELSGKGSASTTLGIIITDTAAR